MLIRSSQLEAHGLTRSQIESLVRSGHAAVVRPGTWFLDLDPHDEVTRSEVTHEARHRRLIDATVQGLRQDAVLSHVSAAVLHGLPVPRDSLAQVTLTRTRGSHGKRTRFLRIHRAALSDSDTTTIDGLAVTTVERTVLDLARSLPGMDALAVADRALALGADLAYVGEMVRAHPRHPGNARARLVIERADARAESAGESWSRWRMHELGVPLPVLQAPILDRHGEEVARSDFLWEEAVLVGEFDGAIKYGRLLKPGQDVNDVVLAEKSREERIRRAG